MKQFYEKFSVKNLHEKFKVKKFHDYVDYDSYMLLFAVCRGGDVATR